jgi:uncharacterized ferritin-like protein (DUF455 family)
MLFNLANIDEKLEAVESSIERAFASPLDSFPPIPAREVQNALPYFHPPKKGLSFKEGQARLLHDLASIELQALELGVRTLHEFPEAPDGFRNELVEIVRGEARHLKLCLQALEKLGFHWGRWPVHTLLWQSVAETDSLLDRILIVHRYLEGSGLDAGDTLLRRLDSVAENDLHQIAPIIVKEEIEHVEFGSRWYREICRQESIDPQEDFAPRLEGFRYRIPKRIEKISRDFRRKAGFTEAELDYLESLRESIIKFPRETQEIATDLRGDFPASNGPRELA